MEGGEHVKWYSGSCLPLVLSILRSLEEDGKVLVRSNCWMNPLCTSIKQRLVDDKMEWKLELKMENETEQHYNGVLILEQECVS